MAEEAGRRPGLAANLEVMEVAMSRRAPPRPRQRTLVRTSQRSRLETESLQRAYELALPIIRQPLAPTNATPITASPKQRRHAS